MSKFTIKGLLGALMISLACGAQAAVIDCPNGYTSLVSGTSGCQYSSEAKQDFLNTNTGWKSITAGGGLGITGGTWSLNESWDNFDQIMMVFESGRGSTLVGYTIESGVTGGTWESPFSAPLFQLRNTRDVSQISFYGHAATVPEPSLLILLLMGLGSVALSRLRAR